MPRGRAYGAFADSMPVMHASRAIEGCGIALIGVPAG